MDAVEYLTEKNRMCKSISKHKASCRGCALFEAGCLSCNTREKAEKAVEVVEGWSKKHPKKTRLNEFLKQYPNAKLIPPYEYPPMCPCEFDSTLCVESRCVEGCDKCRERYWTEEVK